MSGWVTISSTRGAGGHMIGQQLAKSLGLHFVNRAIPAGVAEKLAMPLQEALDRDEGAGRGVGDLLARYAMPLAALSGYPVVVEEAAPSADAYQRFTEDTIWEEVSRGAVLMGRGGAFLLAQQPHVLHVRLDGPLKERSARLAAEEGVSEEGARRQIRQTDHSRAIYVRHFYHRDWTDVSAYHLVVRSTALGVHASVEIIGAAARGFFKETDE